LSDEKPSHYVLATSEMMGDIFSSAFRVPREHIIVDGYPRNDVLFQQCMIEQLYTKEEKEIVEYVKGLKQNKYRILIYMPTFRDSEVKFFDVMDLVGFNKFLQDNKLIFLTKLHPKSKLKSEFERIEVSNIINVSTMVDPYTILGLADMLTTDYSSVYTDFLLLNKPSVLFTYDLEDYTRDTRECYFEYDDYIPELRTYTMEEFQKGILRALEKDEFEKGRINLRNKMFSYVDCKASERILDKMMKI
jgi:CDP-glycerol glycerophosphotransferase (TagB/SpsB family)